VIEPPLSGHQRDRLIATYSTWLDQDDLGQCYVEVCGPAQDIGATSVRQFLADLLRSSCGPDALIRRPAALDHPDSTLLQLLGSPLLTRAGPRGLVEAVARHALCLQVIPRLLIAVSEPRSLADEDLPTPAALPMAGTAIEDQAAAPGITDPAARDALADTLLAILKSRLGQRSIRSFFTVDVSSNGFRLWDLHCRARPAEGTALVRHAVGTAAGDVGIDLLRYPDEEATRVRAYEWCAELREDPGSVVPDAVAYGMVYRFERTDGMPEAGTGELLTAADTLSDVDLLQVNAFLQQHDDAQALIDAGDLAFVWLWERRSGARPGAGQACLRAALTDLRRRFRHIRTLVIDLKPYQYVVSDAEGVPAQLHMEKLEALDRLQSFVDGLRLDDIIKGHCRYIVNRDGDDPAAAMRTLRLAGLAQLEPPEPGKG
jgi:hypothetical protein